MSDDWTDDIEPPRKKGGVPGWVWWTCGTGCLLVVLLAVAAGVGGYVLVQDAQDPEKVNPKLMKYLPCDEWPEDYRGTGMVVMGNGFFTVRWPGGEMMLQPMPNREGLEQIFDADATLAHLGEKDIELGELEVQGRTVRIQRFKQKVSNLQQMRVDISGDVGPYAFLLLASFGEGEVDPSQVEEFLEPFDVWRGED